MASWITSDQWYNNKRSSPDDEAKRVIEIAAKFIESDIRDNLKGSTDTFPPRGHSKSIFAQDSSSFLIILVTAIKVKIKFFQFNRVHDLQN